MNNVHRLVVPKRDDTRRTPSEALTRTGEVLILPCIRYERIELRDAPSTRRVAASTNHDQLWQDLTA